MMNRYMVAIVIIATTGLPVFAQLDNEFQTRDGLTLYLPDGWVEIPGDVLREYADLIGATAPEVKKQTFEYGYQLADVGWLTHPYILVQVRRSGRIAEGELKKHKMIEQSLEKAVMNTQDKMGGLMSGARVGETLYDPSNHILWFNMSMDVPQVGRVVGLMAGKLTEFGLIQITGYATKETAADYVPLYREIALTASLDPDIAYRPRWTDNAPILGGAVRGGVIGAAVVALAGLLAWLARKLKN